MLGSFDIHETSIKEVWYAKTYVKEFWLLENVCLGGLVRTKPMSKRLGKEKTYVIEV
jgi:hypothetical protein